MIRLSHKLAGFTLLALLCSSSPAWAALVYLSPVSTVGGGVTSGNPALSYEAGSGVKSLYIWVSDEVRVGQGFSVNLNVTGTPGVIAFTGARASNFVVSSTILTPFNRWGSVSEYTVGSNANATATAITNVNSVTSNPFGGLRPTNNNAALLDTGYDIPAHAFLWGRVDFQALTPGTATIALSYNATNPNVDDGGTPVPSNAFTYGTAAITVTAAAVPEPATWSLAVIGLLGAGWCRTRRVK
jgi:hypothetical protein